MKKLAMGALFLMLFVGSAIAHDGALALYTDQTLTGCNRYAELMVPDTIRMYYVRDNGPDLGNAVEFRIEISNPLGVLMEWFPNPAFPLSLGSITEDLSLTSTQCVGANESVVYIMSLVMISYTMDMYTVGVREALQAQPPGVYITECTVGNPVVAVIGGTFVYNGNCVPGVKETTWGAIKQLYK